jgi:hypothetical protein
MERRLGKYLSFDLSNDDEVNSKPSVSCKVKALPALRSYIEARTVS